MVLPSVFLTLTAIHCLIKTGFCKKIVFSKDLDLQRSKEVSEDLPPHENDREGYEDRESDHKGLEDNHENREDIKQLQMISNK